MRARVVCRVVWCREVFGGAVGEKRVARCVCGCGVSKEGAVDDALYKRKRLLLLRCVALLYVCVCGLFVLFWSGPDSSCHELRGVYELGRLLCGVGLYVCVCVQVCI